MITLGFILAACIAAILLFCCLGALIEALAQLIPLALCIIACLWLFNACT